MMVTECTMCKKWIETFARLSSIRIFRIGVIALGITDGLLGLAVQRSRGVSRSVYDARHLPHNTISIIFE